MLCRLGDAATITDCLLRVLANVNRNREFGDAACRCYGAGFRSAMGHAALVAGYETAIASPDFGEPQ